MKQDLGCCGLDETQRMREETFTMRNFHYHLVAVDFLKSLCSTRRKPASMLKYLQLYLNQCLVDTTASNWAFSNHAFHLLLNALCLCDVIFSLQQKSSSGRQLNVTFGAMLQNLQVLTGSEEDKNAIFWQILKLGQVLSQSKSQRCQSSLQRKLKKCNVLSGNSKQFTFNKQRCHASI